MQNPNAIVCISVYAVEIPFRALGMRDLCTELGVEPPAEILGEAVAAYG